MVYGQTKLAIFLLFLVILSSSIPLAAFSERDLSTDLKPQNFTFKKYGRITSELGERVVNSLAVIQTNKTANQSIQVYLALDDPNNIKSLPDYVKVERTENNIVQARVPVPKITELANYTYISQIRSPDYAVPTFVDNEGVNVINAGTAHGLGLTGKGVKVAIIDGGFITSDPNISSNIADAFSFLNPKDITGGDTPGNSHGTAVAEIVVAVAPDVQLYLYNIRTVLDFDAAVDRAISKGVNVITSSLGFPTAGGTVGPFFRDGTSTVALKLSQAFSSNIISTIAAGNDAQDHWSGSFITSAFTLFGRPVNNFNPGASGLQQVCLPISVGNGARVILTWQNWPVTNQDYDLYIFDSTLSTIITTSTNSQTGTQPPLEVTPAISSGNYCVVIQNFAASGTASFHLYVDSCSSSCSVTGAVPAGSIGTPADSPAAIAVGAINQADQTLEPFSSRGPTDDGRAKPEVCGPDNVSTSSFGLPNPFFGTSAAAPQVAGLAALDLQQNPTLSASSLKQKISSDARSLLSLGTNICGAGVVNFPQAISVTHISDLMRVYYQRPDLQTVFLEANKGNLQNLLNWAANFGVNEYPAFLGKYMHTYKLMVVYYSRADLQSVFPEAANAVNLSNLFAWAGAFGINEDSRLTPNAAVYKLMWVYHDRSDVQAAFPEASNGVNLSTNLFAWAGAFGINEDSRLTPNAAVYKLMWVYHDRSDVQAAFPEASNGANLHSLICWAKNFGVNEDSRLTPFSSFYNANC